jgi:hypothetical protein
MSFPWCLGGVGVSRCPYTRRSGQHMVIAASSAPAWIALGIAGTTLVWTMFWSVWQHRRTTRVHVRVRTTIALPISGNTPGVPHLSVEAANDGPVAATINSVTLRVRGRREYLIVQWQYADQLPVRLEPGAGHWQGMVPVSHVRQQLADSFGGPQSDWRVHGVVATTVGRTFESHRVMSRRHPWGWRSIRL